MLARPETFACSANPQLVGEFGKVQENALVDDMSPGDAVSSPAVSPPPPLPHAAVNESVARTNAIAVGRIATVARLRTACDGALLEREKGVKRFILKSSKDSAAPKRNVYAIRD
jgi:hypothetical protein